MRHSGHRIGSVGGEKCGYYVITTQQELEEFLSSEYLSKINEMKQTMDAMTKAVSKRWGYDLIQRKRI